MPDTFKLIEGTDPVFRRELQIELVRGRESIEKIKSELEIKIQGLKELMEQHDKLTQVANDKAQETLNERLSKMNEFREQQKDIITKFATITSLDSLSLRVDQNIKSATARYEENVKVLNEKMNSIKTNLEERGEAIKNASEDKRETLYVGVLKMFENVENKLDANLKSEILKFMASDKQMELLINNNADISNRGIDANAKRITELFSFYERLQGANSVLKIVLSAVIAIVIGLVITFLSKYI